MLNTYVDSGPVPLKHQSPIHFIMLISLNFQKQTNREMQMFHCCQNWPFKLGTQTDSENQGKLLKMRICCDIINKSLKMSTQPATLSHPPFGSFSGKINLGFGEVLASLIYFYFLLLIINVVHLSYKSQTAIRILQIAHSSQKAQFPSTIPTHQNFISQLSTPFKRNRPTFNFDRLHPFTNPFKRIHSLNSQKFSQNSCSAFSSLQFGQKRRNRKRQFSLNFDEELEREKCEDLQFPLKLEIKDNEGLNQMLTQKIEIVTEENQKILVSIHDSLLLANTNHSKAVEENIVEIPNIFASELKKKYASQVCFIKEYKSGYAPIALQHMNSEVGEYEENPLKKEEGVASTRSHFIRKKQSTLSLPRSCGVSYIRASESKQAGPFEPLPPLIFQCSSSCNYNPYFQARYQSTISSFISTSLNSWIPFIEASEDDMRDLLLGKPVGKVGWVQGIQSLWPLFSEGTFFVLLWDARHLMTEQEVWQHFNQSIFQIGILCKKSTSGKKSFLRSVQYGSAQDYDLNTKLDEKSTSSNSFTEKIEESKQNQELGKHDLNNRIECLNLFNELSTEFESCRTVITLSLKLEMYVQEQDWKMLDADKKNLLNGLIQCLKDNLEKKSLEIIRDRLNLSKSAQKQAHLQEVLQKIIRVSNKQISHSATLPFLGGKGHFSQETLHTIIRTLKETQTKDYQMELRMGKSSFTFADIVLLNQNEVNLQKSLKMPIYYISTRDSFAFDLIEKVQFLQRKNGSIFKKIEYFFENDNLPTNFTEYLKLFPEFNVGVTCYHNFFTSEELCEFEKNTMQTEVNAFKNKFLQMTVQPTIVGNRIKRTKFFFGYRYMWTRCQLAQSHSYVGAGVRKDVTPAPEWIQSIQQPLVENGLLEPGFINSVAINVYHDGKEGLAQHFDDAVRFKQPIYTLRLVSDGRLSFGSQFYGFCNGAFIIPLPRGCICVMAQNSYAANGVKHCIRPCDMTGKSAAVILRQMHSEVVNESAKYDELVDFPCWLSTASECLEPMSYAEQKRRESQQILKLKE